MFECREQMKRFDRRHRTPFAQDARFMLCATVIQAGLNTSPLSVADDPQVSFYRCSPEYAVGLTDLEREHPNAVQGQNCELAWRGVLHDHGALR